MSVRRLLLSSNCLEVTHARAARSSCLFALMSSSSRAGRAEPPRRDYRALMRQFVQKISERAKADRPGFLVVPQGGIGLLKHEDRASVDYLRAIDGVGQEEVFYGYDNQDNRRTPPTGDGVLPRTSEARPVGRQGGAVHRLRERAEVDGRCLRPERGRGVHPVRRGPARTGRRASISRASGRRE